MKDPTQPLPAPEGYRWNFVEASGSPGFYIQLWRVDEEIPTDILAQMLGDTVEVYFETERGIRAASKTAVEALAEKHRREEIARRVLSRNERRR